MHFHRLNRREFIMLLGGGAAATWPVAVRAQQKKLYRVGVLVLGNADAAFFRTVLREELSRSGYIEDQNVFFEFRSAEGRMDQLPKLAAELVALKVDVMVGLFTPCAHAAQQATREIPSSFTRATQSELVWYRALLARAGTSRACP